MNNKTFKYRIYPNEEQKQQINKTLGCCRFVWNYLLGKQKEKEDMWITVQRMVNEGYFEENNYKSEYFKKFTANKDVTQLKKNYEWLKEVDSSAFEYLCADLDESYKKYYKRQGGKPRFKSKRNPIMSYTTRTGFRDNSVKIEGNKIKISKLGWVDIVMERPLEGESKMATIIHTNSDKYYISIVCGVDIEPLEKTNKRIGIDLGIKDNCILSTGEKIQSPDCDEDYKKIEKLQKKLSKQKYGSNRYNKTKIKLAKAHEHVANKRKHYQHELSTKLIREYDTVVMEDLDVSKMLEKKEGQTNKDNAFKNKLITQEGWYSFKEKMEYKAKWYGKEVITADKYFASSQICSVCGKKNKKVKNLSVRKWKCDKCGAIHDRDINAAINLENYSKK